MKALPKILLALTAFAALSIAYPASVHAVPTTYQYIGNPFTEVVGPSYTTSDFVTAMITLTGPLGANFSGFVSATAFTFSDGFQTITDISAFASNFFFKTDAAGAITNWDLVVVNNNPFGSITTANSTNVFDEAFFFTDSGLVRDDPGKWSVAGAVADTGSTLSLMTLTLMALGLVARRLERAAA